MRRLSLAIAAVLALSLAVSARADALGATQARDALERGAQAWDVRADATAWLPGAAQAELAAWARSGALDELARAVSRAGIDLSRDVVVYGRAGDPQAQALVAALARVATGQVHWLVGGIDEWQAAGLPTAAQATRRYPVPQRLVARDDTPGGQPAAASLRGGSSVPAQPLLATRG